MFRCLSEKCARDLSAKHDLLYGFSVFDGKWYVGTAAQLDRIGVLAPECVAFAAPEVARS